MADDLLAAVLADPDANLPRLVYADWLDDAGDSTRAEFVRVQVALATDPGNLALVAREQVLLSLHSVRWLAPLRAKGEPLQNLGTHGRFRRGFVEEVWLSAGVFLWKGEKLFRRAPVRAVRLIRGAAGEVREVISNGLAGRLRELDVSGRDGREIAAAVTVADADRLPPVLRAANCGLGDDGAELLATADRGWRPAELDVRFNPLTDAGRDRLRLRFGAAVRT